METMDNGRRGWRMIQRFDTPESYHQWDNIYAESSDEPFERFFGAYFPHDAEVPDLDVNGYYDDVIVWSIVGGRCFEHTVRAYFEFGTTPQPIGWLDYTEWIKLW